jgi:ABC-type branched-subunit amino acid transport system ATPase component
MSSAQSELRVGEFRDQTCLLRAGQITAVGARDELLRHESLQRLLLGGAREVGMTR